MTSPPLGVVAAALRDVDWDRTPLGRPEQWPASLATTVRTMLASRFPMWMAWGPELTLLCNDPYSEILADKFPQALGRPAAEVWAEIWPDVGPRIARVMESGEATWDEGLLLFLERSGYREETYFTFSYSPLTDDDGDVAGMLCVVSEDTPGVVGARRMATVRDLGAALTALRTQDEVLQAARDVLAADPASLPFTLTYLVDPDSGDAVLAGATGLAPGHDAAPARLRPDDDGVWPLPELLQGRTVVVEALPERWADLPTGPWEEPPLAAVCVPFRQQDEQPVGFLVAGVDRYRPLDDEHRGFVELLAGQVAAALGGARAHEEERERAERLLELDRAKTAFFTNVSHEFRTPLTLMLGPAEDALADTAHPLDDVQRERVEIVHRNGERLLKLVNTLLDFHRLEAGGLQGAFEPVDLAAYTAELARAFSAAVDRVGLTLEVDCPPLPEPVHVDREMWAKVVLNLLSNALKFTFEGGITVRLDAVDGAARLQVQDTGTGIAPEQQGALFTRFSRVGGAASRSHEGSGIGLALVADLAAAHGGAVSVDSAPGRGSTFTVTVPLGTAHLPPEQLVTPAPLPVGERDTALRTARGFLAEAMRWLTGDTRGAETPETAPDAARPLVLVVDDNADMRDYVARLLAVDHEVLTAADGVQGLELVRRRTPDLVLSDVMMPRLDGFGLLSALRADPVTAQVPVVLLSARAGEEATVEGLEAGADDYLAKPFSGRELLARVRANLELERGRRTRRDLQRSQELLDQAQRLARVGSWELDLATEAVRASAEFHRQLQVTPEQLQTAGLAHVMGERVHPEDRERVAGHLKAAVEDSAPIDYEVRAVLPDGVVRTFRTIGEVERDDDGRPVRLRGSNQDVTEQRASEQALASATATAEAAAREHRIADELQRSLLPPPDVAAESLRIAAYYRAGVEGTQVGGDWYDVIELGAGRTALVLGDVMGRGVRAAAVMGQLRSAVRAYARLDLPPADVLEHLDGVVRDLGEDQIVTCVYAVYDPHEQLLTYANAGHLPPLVRRTDGSLQRLADADGPPLGTASASLTEQSVQLEAGALLALYTDGLVERRDSDIDDGVDALGRLLAEQDDGLDPGVPQRLVDGMLPEGPDDDVAVLLAEVEPVPSSRVATLALPDDLRAVGRMRRTVGGLLREWGVDGDLRDSVLLLLSELSTNALVHGRAPAEVRLRLARTLVLEVHDSASYLPSRRRPDDDDEHGRGLQLVSLLAARWGTRPTAAGKAVWCVFEVEP